ncbi:MAG: 5-(carboxyamino)imidazole ribonucleotide synthase [Egibacteraceae bacterium]
MAQPRVGVVGAGQLARMMLPEAIALDVGLALLAADPADAAAQRCPDVTVGGDLAAFATACDALTFDHELVDPDALARAAEAGAVLRPCPRALRFAQDKVHQRTQFAAHGLPVPEHAIAEHADGVRAAGEALGWPLVLKAPLGGYDGRGVVTVDGPDAAGAALEALGGPPALAERAVTLDAELAVLVARRPSGETVRYPPTLTVQAGGICTELLAPADLPPAVLEAAGAVADRVAALVDAVGVLAIELFVEDGEVLVNEVATRPHNSGHWTIDGAVTSQFANHLRGVLDWPLGSTAMTVGAAATVNVLGPADGHDPRAARAATLAVPGVAVHWYGKGARPGRKLGHVTAVGEDAAETRARAQRAAAILLGEEAGDGR